MAALAAWPLRPLAQPAPRADPRREQQLPPRATPSRCALAAAPGGRPGRGTCPALVGVALGLSWALPVRRRARGALRATARSLDLDIEKKVGKKEEEETSTSRDMWVVLVHAPIRNCRMPWCKVPGLRKLICTCLKDGVEPGAGIRSKDGKCALTLNQYAEVLAEGVPVLSRAKTYEVSSRLFESAMANPVGSAVVIGTFKVAAEEYHQRLRGLGLWTSLEQVDRD